MDSDDTSWEPLVMLERAAAEVNPLCALSHVSPYPFLMS
jgi:hypothetical protein